MNLVKVIPVLLFALFIDAIQFFVSLSLSVVAAFPGTLGGCAVGSYYAGKIGCFVLGAIGTIPVVNGALATVTEPLGIVLGFAVSACISFMLGSMLVLFLLFLGILNKRAVLMTYVGEALPGFGILPAWTGLVVYSVYKDSKEKALGTGVGGLLSFGSMLGAQLNPLSTPAGNAVRQGSSYGQAQAVQDTASFVDDIEPEETAELEHVQRQTMTDVKINLKSSVSNARINERLDQRFSV
jgi:hypothetical protein